MLDYHFDKENKEFVFSLDETELKKYNCNIEHLDAGIDVAGIMSKAFQIMDEDAQKYFYGKIVSLNIGVEDGEVRCSITADDNNPITDMLREIFPPEEDEEEFNGTIQEQEFLDLTFSSFNDIMLFVPFLDERKIKDKESHIIKVKGKYHLVLRKKKADDSYLMKVAVLAEEYSKCMGTDFCTKAWDTCLTEHGLEVISHDAIKTVKKII